MNWLGFEGRGVKVKVATRSAVQNFGTPYLLNGFKDHNQIWVCNRVWRVNKLTRFSRSWVKVKFTARSSIWMTNCGGRRHPHRHLGVEVSSSLTIFCPLSIFANLTKSQNNGSDFTCPATPMCSMYVSRSIITEPGAVTRHETFTHISVSFITCVTSFVMLCSV